MADAKRSGNFLLLDPMERAADAASALAAIRVSTEDARLHAALQIGGVVHGHFENTQLFGFDGGLTNARAMPSGISSF